MLQTYIKVWDYETLFYIWQSFKRVLQTFLVASRFFFSSIKKSTSSLSYQRILVWDDMMNCRFMEHDQDKMLYLVKENEPKNQNTEKFYQGDIEESDLLERKSIIFTFKIIWCFLHEDKWSFLSLTFLLFSSDTHTHTIDKTISNWNFIIDFSSRFRTKVFQ